MDLQTPVEGSVVELEAQPEEIIIAPKKIKKVKKKKVKNVKKEDSYCCAEAAKFCKRQSSYAQPKKLHKKKYQKSLKSCNQDRPYLHNFLSDLWSYLTPDIIDTLKEMLVQEFGMKPRDAEIFLLDQRLKTVFKGASERKPFRLPCFPFPPDCPAPSPGLPFLPFSSQLPEGFPFCPPPCPSPGSPLHDPPPCISTKNSLSFPCLPFPCSPIPSCPPPASYPCCASPSRISYNDKKKSKKNMKGRKTVGLRNYWVKELTSTLTIKLNDYVAMLLPKKRSKRVKIISDVILKHLKDITGEECTSSKANTRAQKLMVFIADRLAIWLANISCTCDAAMKEICENKREERISKYESKINGKEPNKTSGIKTEKKDDTSNGKPDDGPDNHSGKKADNGGDKSRRKRNNDSDNPSGKIASDEGNEELTYKQSVDKEPKEAEKESKDKIEGGEEKPEEAIQPPPPETDNEVKKEGDEVMDEEGNEDQKKDDNMEREKSAEETKKDKETHKYAERSEERKVEDTQDEVNKERRESEEVTMINIKERSAF